jgi:hypothetical protein
MRFHNACLTVMLCLDGISCFLAAIVFLMVRCKDGGEVDVEGCGRLSVHDGLLEVAWFCVCKLGGSLAGNECKLCGGGR